MLAQVLFFIVTRYPELIDTLDALVVAFDLYKVQYTHIILIALFLHKIE